MDEALNAAVQEYDQMRYLSQMYKDTTAQFHPVTVCVDALAAQCRAKEMAEEEIVAMCAEFRLGAEKAFLANTSQEAQSPS